MTTATAVDPRGPRFSAIVTTAVLAVVLVSGWWPLLAAQTVVFAIGAFVGLRPAPYSVLYRRLVDEVTADRVLQFVLPVDAHGAADVPTLVRGGVLIDLGEDDTVGVQVLLCPLGGDQDVFTAHGNGTRFLCFRKWLRCRWSCARQRRGATGAARSGVQEFCPLGAYLRSSRYISQPRQ